MNGERNGYLEAWLLFLKAHALVVGQLAEEMEVASNLPLNWYDVLVQLSTAPEGRLRMHDLVRGLVLSKSGLTRRIDRMEGTGLVARCGCPEDRRGVLVCLTPAGEAALSAAAPAHLRGIDEHFTRHLTAAEAAAMESAFGKIVAALEAQDPPGSLSARCPAEAAATES